MSPRFQVIEKRAYYDGILIDAVNEDAARARHGEIVADESTDSWADELHSVEQVADSTEAIDLP